MRSRRVSWIKLVCIAAILSCLAAIGVDHSHGEGNQRDTVGKQSWYFIHITDTHVGETAFGSTLRFQAMVDSINALVPPPEFVVITGDLVDLASSANYMLFNAIDSTFTMPSYTSPGNHDYRGVIGVDEYKLWVSSELDYTWQHLGLEIISMDSGNDTNYIEGEPPLYELDMLPEATGFAPDQYSWLDSCLNESPEVGKILCMHHPVVCCEPEYNYDEGSGNACINSLRPEVWNLLADPDSNGNHDDAVKVVLTGHTHYPYEYEADSLEAPSTVSVPPGGYVSTSDYDLPLYVITAEALNLAYRQIVVHDQEIHVFENAYFEDFLSVFADWRSPPAGTLPGKSDSVCDPCGRFHMYDSAGNHVGIGEGNTFVFEIPAACYRSRSMDDDPSGCHRHVGEEISVILSDEVYDLILEATETSTLRLGYELVTEAAGRLWITYPDIPAYPASRGSLTIYGDSLDPILYWDEDGDGQVDTLIVPDPISSVGAWPSDPPDEPMMVSVPGPNPFSGTIVSKVMVRHPGPVSVDVYDISGRKIRGLFADRIGSEQQIEWDGATDRGIPASSGVYFVRFRMNGFDKSVRVVLLR